MTRKVHLKLVTDFGEITKGARCGIMVCPRSERFVETKAVEHGDFITANGWMTDHLCDGAAGVIDRVSVAARRVYLILDGAEDPEATETTAPKELELAR